MTPLSKIAANLKFLSGEVRIFSIMRDRQFLKYSIKLPPETGQFRRGNSYLNLAEKIIEINATLH